MRFLVIILTYLLSFFLSSLVFAAPVKIVWWHAMAGPLGSEVNHLASVFNASQTKYQVQPVYKGSYAETLMAFSAAYRVHEAPALLQVFEVGKTSMSYPAGLTKPVAHLFQEQHIPLPFERIWPALRHAYSQQGTLAAFPFNVSLPVMYYNVDRLKALGYTKENFPTTWRAFDQLLHRLQQQGEHCAYTSAYPSWIHIESFLALHGLSPAQYDSPALKQHLKRLKQWQQQHLFEYAGRLDEATILFTSGKCSIFSQSSGALESLQGAAAFPVGLAAMPYDADFVKRPAANVVGGGALWVVAGQPRAVEEGIVAFLQFILRDDVQARWYERTGYLPITQQQLTLRRAEQQPESNMHRQQSELLHLVASEWMVGPEQMPWMPAQHRVRAMNDEALESLFAGVWAVEQTLSQMSKSRLYAFSRFEKNHGMT